MASALADWRAIRSGSVLRPRSASQASNGPGMPPPLDRQARSAASRSGSRLTTAPRITSECPETALVSEYSEAVAPGLERPLEQAGGDGVVHDHGRARRGRQGAEPGQVGHPEQRVGRRLGPQHRRRGGQLALDGGQVPQVHRDRHGAVRPQPVRQDPPP